MREDTTGRTKIRILLADDHKLVREGVKAILAQAKGDVALVGEAASGKEVMDWLEKLETDVVLIDICMPEPDGIEATRQIRQRFPWVKVLVLSMMEDERLILKATEAGANGYVLKTAGFRELLYAISTVYEGEEYFCSDIARNLLRKMQAALHAESLTEKEKPGPGNRSVDSPGAGTNTGVAISAREREVLRLIAQGYTNAEIGEKLYTSRRTIESHRKNLLEKTGTTNTATLILYAVSHNLL